MRKTLLSALIAAGAVAAVGVAQAETFDSPQQAGEASTMTMGNPNALTTNSPYGDGVITQYSYVVPGTTTVYTSPSTTVLGAGPAWSTTTYETTYPAYSYSYVLPAPVVTSQSWSGWNNNATETSNVPQRAGEASTMTGGAPNLVTNNYAW